MLELIVYVDGNRKKVDLFQDEPVNFELSFAEIHDIALKNSGYSKSFQVPGTKNNNRIFNYFYNPVSIANDFDSRIKYEAALNYNGYEILPGYVRLVSVSQTNKDDVVYSVVFYGTVGDLASTIADKNVNELDFTDYNHTWTWENVYKSWLLDEDNGQTGIYNGAILYPLLDRGGLYR